MYNHYYVHEYGMLQKGSAENWLTFNIQPYSNTAVTVYI